MPEKLSGSTCVARLKPERAVARPGVFHAPCPAVVETGRHCGICADVAEILRVSGKVVINRGRAAFVSLATTWA